MCSGQYQKGEYMKGYILRWNPNISSWTDERHEQFMQVFIAENGAKMNWSVYDFEDLEIGDFFILQRVGSDCDGISGFGTFSSEPYTERSWKRRDGTNLFYADLDFALLLDRQKFKDNKIDKLSAKNLEMQFPQIDWHKGHSGVLIPNELMENLIIALSLATFNEHESSYDVAFKSLSKLFQWMCDRINEYCPTLRKKIIKEKRDKLVYKNFKPSDTLDESVIDLTYDKNALKKYSPKNTCDLEKFLIPRA